MIFNNTKTEKEVIEECIKNSGIEYGFILEVRINSDNIVIQEAGFPASTIGMPEKRTGSRFILIGRSNEASHGGRMKVSKPGLEIYRGKSDQYISIYVKNEKKHEVGYSGSLKAIGMSNKEFELYADLCFRNNNLIQLAKNADLEDFINKAFIEDENRRKQGILFTRERNGDLIYYDHPYYDSYGTRRRITENIKGEIIDVTVC
jgi:hypothetical protein